MAREKPRPILPIDPGTMFPRVIPFPRQDVAVIEPFVHPLWSAVALDAAVIPAEVSFFTYGQGQDVNGAGAGVVRATELHTNIRTPSRLSTPKIALITGFSLVVPQLTAVMGALKQATDGAAETATTSDLVEDLQRILYGTVFQFEVGALKDYYTAPSWNLPGNVGVEGVVALSVNALVTQGPIQFNLTSVQGMGQFQELYQSPILIPSEQEFSAKIMTRQAAPPVIATATLLYCVLPAIQGREVM